MRSVFFQGILSIVNNLLLRVFNLILVSALHKIYRFSWFTKIEYFINQFLAGYFINVNLYISFCCAVVFLNYTVFHLIIFIFNYSFSNVFHVLRVIISCNNLVQDIWLFFLILYFIQKLLRAPSIIKLRELSLILSDFHMCLLYNWVIIWVLVWKIFLTLILLILYRVLALTKISRNLNRAHIYWVSNVLVPVIILLIHLFRVHWTHWLFLF